jgi:DNA polymerase II
VTQSLQQGFILTRHWRDSSAGTEIEFWLVTDHGPKKVRLTSQTSVAFAHAGQRTEIEPLVACMSGIEIQPLTLKTFQQEPVIGVYSRHYRQLTTLEKALKERDIKLYEVDIRPPERYMMERFITASVQIEGGSDDGSVIVDCKLKPAPEYRPALRAVSLDIETSAHGDLYSIALEGCGERQVYMLDSATGADADAPPQDFHLDYCENHKQMIEKLNAWFKKHDPDVVIGWSLVQFDLRILQSHADKCKVPLALGRGGKSIEWRGHGSKDGYLFAPTAGRLIVDGIDALKAALWSFPSFSLENVSRALLGEGKAIDNPYDRMEEIERRFREDKLALARYNIKDCELVTRIFAKAKLFEFLLERANVTGLQADHFGGSIAAFSHHYLPRMHREGYVAPNVGEIAQSAFPGGFVMDSRPGLYDSVIVLDFKSLYASIIRTFLVDPIGLVEGALAPDSETVVQGVNGTFFSRHKHCLPAIVTQLWERRDEAKRQRNEPLSQVLKLLMNSFCGVLGSPDCRFFNPELVSAVTLRGHQIMRQTRLLVEAEGYEVIYGDTDSIFIWLRKRHTESAALEVGNQLADTVNQWWAQHLDQTLGLQNALELEFDIHYQRFFMPTIRGADQGSKKRYAGLVKKADGHEEIIYRGLETARSDWTPLAQKFQQGLYMRIFKLEPYDEFVRDYVQKTLDGEFDNLLIYRKRLRRQLGDYQRNVPPHVRAARIADQFNAQRQRPLQYQNGGWINYVMTLNGPEPTEAIESRIDYEHYLTHQLQPIADAILLPMNDSFKNLTNAQGKLF